MVPKWNNALVSISPVMSQRVHIDYQKLNSWMEKTISLCLSWINYYIIWQGGVCIVFFMGIPSTTKSQDPLNNKIR